jgi:dTDP-4-amino-4,6-dideoxygalactose transaminase
MIPFIDLPLQHRALEEELVQVFRDALETASFIGGPQVQAFEEEFAAFCGSKHCVGVNSGTDALRFALIAAGIGPGDAVITVPNTFIATVEAISQAGATPVFVDVDEKTHNLDPVKLDAFLQDHFEPLPPSFHHSTIPSPQGGGITPRPKAIIPVHLYGQPCDMEAILDVAGKYGLIVIEDACQAHGAEYFSKREKRWKKCGTLGAAAAFSFYPGKNLGACGEAGAVTTDNPELARTIRMLRDHGQAKKYHHDIEGYNGRLDALQAGWLRVKLRHLAQWNQSRRENAQHYSGLLRDLDGVTPPFEPLYSRSVHHLYVIRSRRRDALQKYLAEQGIATGIHYPVPIHLQNACIGLGYEEGDFLISEKLANEILSLPMYPELTYDQQKKVVESIRQFLSEESPIGVGRSMLRPVKVNQPSILRARGSTLRPTVTNKV